MNADVLEVNPGSVGLNLFAYCNNNPIIYSDHNGEVAIAISTLFLFAVIFILLIPVIQYMQQPQFKKAWSDFINGIYYNMSEGLRVSGQVINDSISWISSQARNIAKSIQDSLTTIRVLPNYKSKYELHHIVAQAALNAKPARDIINKVLCPQGVQHQNNLIYIKTGVHRRLHTNVYYYLVNNVIQSAYNKASGSVILQKQYVNKALYVLRNYLKTMSDLAPF